ncbi:MAG: UDP-glucose 4-epimerase GalE [Candidatus Saccharibacteria bacterium]|nr:UDP-glucose 4-epimerase GalE [Candidatus Saccharibacteria bacterium]
MKNILVTGGTGYIGSHTVIELINNNFNPIIVDNLINSSIEVLDKLKQITNKDPIFYQVDVCDKPKLQKIFQQHQIDAVIHFAGLKAVGESVAKPLEYYRNNIDSSLSLLEVMCEFNVKKLIFSSSATVYGNQKAPFSENMPIGQGITNPYGQTKFMIEQIIKDVCVANPDFEATVLRYFNPIGAHKSGLIGESPNGIPNNLLPYVMKVVTGELPEVRIFGNNYDTVDGTGVRDYIHVVDLAQGHIAALQHSQPGFEAYNLGTGKGTSVLEIIKAVEQASGHSVPYSIQPRRPGDLATAYADCTKSAEKLHWQTKKTVVEACKDSYRFNNSQTK